MSGLRSILRWVLLPGQRAEKALVRTGAGAGSGGRVLFNFSLAMTAVELKQLRRKTPPGCQRASTPTSCAHLPPFLLLCCASHLPGSPLRPPRPAPAHTHRGCPSLGPELWATITGKQGLQRGPLLWASIRGTGQME